MCVYFYNDMEIEVPLHFVHGQDARDIDFMSLNQFYANNSAMSYRTAICLWHVYCCWCGETTHQTSLSD